MVIPLNFWNRCMFILWKKPVQYPLWVTLVAFGFQAWLAPTMPFLLTFRRGCYAPCLKMIDTKWNNFQVELFWWKGTGVICVACCWRWITSAVPYPSPFLRSRIPPTHMEPFLAEPWWGKRKVKRWCRRDQVLHLGWFPKKNNNQQPPFSWSVAWGVINQSCPMPCNITGWTLRLYDTTGDISKLQCWAPAINQVRSGLLGRWRRRRRELMFVIEWRLHQNEQNDKTNWNVCVFARQISFLPVSFESEFFKSTQKFGSVSKNLPVNLRLPDRASTLPWSLCLCLWWWYLGSRLLLTGLDITFNEASGKSKNWRQQTRFMSQGLWIVTTTRRMLIDDILSLQMTITFALIR